MDVHGPGTVKSSFRSVKSKQNPQPPSTFDETPGVMRLMGVPFKPIKFTASWGHIAGSWRDTTPLLYPLVKY